MQATNLDILSSEDRERRRWCIYLFIYDFLVTNACLHPHSSILANEALCEWGTLITKFEILARQVTSWHVQLDSRTSCNHQPCSFNRNETTYSNQTRSSNCVYVQVQEGLSPKQKNTPSAIRISAFRAASFNFIVWFACSTSP